MAHRIAGIDIHKKVVMVVVTGIAEAAAAETAGEEVKDNAVAKMKFECHRFGTSSSERNHLTAWLVERGVEEVVMESTAQYWRPIWLELEPHIKKMHLAQAHSNRAPKGRKHDFRDAKRLTRRMVAGELILSFVPEPQQRAWRTMTRGKQQLIRDRVRLQNQLEALLEETRIKLSSVISDLLGASGRRILQALAEGTTDPRALAALGDERLKCTKAELADALKGQPEPMHLEILKLYLERLKLLDQQIAKLDEMAAKALNHYQDAVIRLAEAPGFGVDSAQQFIAEVGWDAKTFPSARQCSSWVGVCPGSDISAEENHSSRSPKGNRFVRKILTQAAQAAVKKKGCHFQSLFRRFLPKLGYNGAIWVVAHRLCCLAWKILHDCVRYIEQGEETNPKAKKRRAQKLAQALRKLGYAVTISPLALEPARVSSE